MCCKKLEKLEFSVIITIYNKEKDIAQTLRSVYAQTYSPKEIIIVNDGSTDNSLQVVRQLADDRVRIIDQANQGVSVARNTGISAAECEYLALLDGDDLWKENMLACMAGLIAEFPDCGLYGSNYELCAGEDAQPMREPTGKNFIIDKDKYFADEQENRRLWSSAVVLRKSVMRDSPGFEPGRKIGEDLRVWIELLTRYDAGYCDRVLAVYNLSASNMNSAKKHDRRDSAAADILERAIEQGHPNAAAMTGYLNNARRELYLYNMINGNREYARGLARKLTGISSLKRSVMVLITRLPAGMGRLSARVLNKLKL